MPLTKVETLSRAIVKSETLCVGKIAGAGEQKRDMQKKDSKELDASGATTALLNLLFKQGLLFHSGQGLANYTANPTADLGKTLQPPGHLPQSASKGRLLLRISRLPDGTCAHSCTCNYLS